MKTYYFAKFEIETLSELFDSSKFKSVLHKNKEKAIESAERFRHYLKENHPEDSSKYKLYKMEIKKVK